jgi:hypothetical protein
MPTLEKNVTFEEVQQSGQPNIYYSALTPWWTHDPGDLDTTQGIPLDPSGAPLYMGETGSFMRSCIMAGPNYGENGLNALMAAHHKNFKPLEGEAKVLPNWKFYDVLFQNTAQEIPGFQLLTP